VRQNADITAVNTKNPNKEKHMTGKEWTEIEILRDGEIKLTIWATIEQGGLIRLRNGGLLLSGDKVAPADRARIKADADAGRLTDEVGAAAVRLGDNGNGLIARIRPTPADTRSDAQRERDEIYLIADQAERAEHAAYYDPARICQLRAEHDRKLAEWREKYPAEAVEEQRAALIRKAEKFEELAIGASFYDSDGWLDEQQREKRAAEFRAEAEALRKKADDMGEDSAR
jgi:hypothetical protein